MCIAYAPGVSTGLRADNLCGKAFGVVNKGGKALGADILQLSPVGQRDQRDVVVCPLQLSTAMKCRLKSLVNGEPL